MKIAGYGKQEGYMIIILYIIYIYICKKHMLYIMYIL